MIIKNLNQVKETYQYAAERGWVIPCICSENLTTTEAILSAASDFAKENEIKRMPVTLAITCNYDHRSQAPYYTHTRNTNVGLKLFTSDVKVLTEKGAPFENLDVMLHLDHIQHDDDIELLQSPLDDYASIMYDASNLPFDENIRKTAEFVESRRSTILIEGACDEIVDYTGGAHNDLTTPENAERYITETGVDMIVANLGTEHRASGKALQYHGDLARKIKEKIGTKIVLHGASSVTNEQVKNLFSDGICKVNIWTALERDSAPALLAHMVKSASLSGGIDTVDELIKEGYLTEKCRTDKPIAISHFTNTARQTVVFEEMKKIVRAYYDLWYL